MVPTSQIMPYLQGQHSNTCGKFPSGLDRQDMMETVWCGPTTPTLFLLKISILGLLDRLLFARR